MSKANSHFLFNLRQRNPRFPGNHKKSLYFTNNKGVAISEASPLPGFSKESICELELEIKDNRELIFSIQAQDSLTDPDLFWYLKALQDLANLPFAKDKRPLSPSLHFALETLLVAKYMGSHLPICQVPVQRLFDQNQTGYMDDNQNCASISKLKIHKNIDRLILKPVDYSLRNSSWTKIKCHQTPQLEIERLISYFKRNKANKETKSSHSKQPNIVLDCNQNWTINQLSFFWQSLPSPLKHSIKYIEEPLKHSVPIDQLFSISRSLGVTIALDERIYNQRRSSIKSFISNIPLEFPIIYKPTLVGGLSLIMPIKEFIEKLKCIKNESILNDNSASHSTSNVSGVKKNNYPSPFNHIALSSSFESPVGLFWICFYHRLVGSQFPAGVDTLKGHYLRDFRQEFFKFNYKNLDFLDSMFSIKLIKTD